MIPVKTVDQANQRNTIVPIPIDAIREFFINKEIVFMVDYADSRLKGATFLTYLSNLNVPADVLITSQFTKEDYFSLMKAYMTQRMITDCPMLNHLSARILLLAKGTPFQELPYESPFAQLQGSEIADNESEIMYEFMVDNKDIVINWMHFMDSSYVFCAHSIAAIREKVKPEENFEVIDNKEYVGHNIVRLYGLNGFMAFYFSIEQPLRQSYFKQQFEEYMFANKRLVEWFDVNQNVIARGVEGLANGKIDPANLGDLFDQLKVQDHEQPEHQNG